MTPGPASPGAVVVRYAVEGGYAHLPREVVVHEDGALALDRGGARAERQWSPSEVVTLVADLEATGLFTEDRELRAPGGADRQRYEVACAGATVVAYDGTVPSALAAVLARLDAELVRP